VDVNKEGTVLWFTLPLRVGTTSRWALLPSRNSGQNEARCGGAAVQHGLFRNHQLRVAILVRRGVVVAIVVWEVGAGDVEA
jgi:hypothetical protein